MAQPTLSETANGKPTGEQADPLEGLGELPRSYGSDAIFLVAQEPHWLFTYWDIDIAKHPGGPAFLRVIDAEGRLETEIEVPFETRNWYIPVKRAGSLYRVEIGYRRGDTWHRLAEPAEARTPPEKLSDSDAFDFATVPLHLSFEKLMGQIRHSLRGGEELLQALARLQRDGKLFAAGPLADLSGDQRKVLDAILGPGTLEELSSGGLSSEEVQNRVRKALEERLSSAGASEWAAFGGASSAESSLFSALGALAGAGQLASWSQAAQASWGPSALSSWVAAALTSWAAAARASWGAAESASWARAAESSWPGPAGWSPEQLSSWLAAAITSWAAAARASWGVAESASWARAAESSWNEQAFSSWARAAAASWGGASEQVSSFGAARGFFMHVNAEVIFYGGTDPRAKVTIDGKPVALNPDGSFRFHFIFPDGTYEIPIVATSPDGIETRSATLRFERATAKSGKVDDTGQPPLGARMGAVGSRG